jgi:hypothetical protein
MPEIEVVPTAPGVAYCGASTLDGGTCRQIVGLDKASGLCPFHDPERAEEVTAMRRKGAQVANARERQPDDTPPPAEPKTLADVITWHSWITGAFARGQLNKAECTGLAYNLQQLRAALVSRDLEREVEELRATVKMLRERRSPR